MENSIFLSGSAVVEALYISAVEGDDRSNIDVDKITRIFACATMWHETPEEMMEFLKSIFRMDEDQAAHRIVKQYLQYPMEGYYEWESMRSWQVFQVNSSGFFRLLAHIFFDDAFWRKSADDNDPELNTYVKDLIATLGEAANEVHKTTGPKILLNLTFIENFN